MIKINMSWDQLTTRENFKISKDEYEQFKREYIIYALADKRFGQAFCERFDLSGILYFFKDQNISERWITDNYLVSK